MRTAISVPRTKRNEGVYNQLVKQGKVCQDRGKNDEGSWTLLQKNDSAFERVQQRIRLCSLLNY